MGIDTGTGVNGLPAPAVSVSFGDGFGSGGDPQIAAGHFEEIAERISTFVCGADVIVIVAGLGRGTGSGVSPLVAGIARQAGALTLAVVNVPFEFEGRSRLDCADSALAGLRASSDAVFAIGNSIAGGPARNGARLSDVFEETNRMFSNSINAVVTSLESCEGRVEEISGCLRNLRSSAIATGSSTGLHAGKSAVEIAFRGLALSGSGPEPRQIESALVHVEGGIGMSAGQVAEVVTNVRARVGGRAIVNVSSTRELVMGGKVRVTLFLSASGSLADPMRAADRQTAPEFVRVDRAGAASLSIFETPRPVRSRGPMLLPAG